MNIDDLKKINKFKFETKLFFICVKKTDFINNGEKKKVQNCINKFYLQVDKINEFNEQIN